MATKTYILNNEASGVIYEIDRAQHAVKIRQRGKTVIVCLADIINIGAIEKAHKNELAARQREARYIKSFGTVQTFNFTERDK